MINFEEELKKFHPSLEVEDGYGRYPCKDVEGNQSGRRIRGKVA